MICEDVPAVSLARATRAPKTKQQQTFTWKSVAPAKRGCAMNATRNDARNAMMFFAKKHDAGTKRRAGGVYSAKVTLTHTSAKTNGVNGEPRARKIKRKEKADGLGNSYLTKTV